MTIKSLLVNVDNLTTTSDSENEDMHWSDLQIIVLEYEKVKEYLYIALFILGVIIIKAFIHFLRKNVKIFRLIPETCFLIFFGLVFGLIGVFVLNDLSGIVMERITADVFFLILLPPIIFDAGYFMPTEAFYQNIQTIFTFAILGTLINAVLIGTSLYGVWQAGWISPVEVEAGVELDITTAILFGSIIAAVDPVAVIAVFQQINVNIFLFICVFGESLFNDGVAVVLARTFESLLEYNPEILGGIEILYFLLRFIYIALGGILIGTIFGFFTGYISRTLEGGVRMYEPFIILLLAYLSYITAECLGTSAILSVVMTGLIMRHIVEYNLHEKSVETLHDIIHVSANFTEVGIFIWLGCISANINFFEADWYVVIWVNLFCFVYRVFSTTSLSALLNLFRERKISAHDQIIMAIGGLRGGIAFSLMELIPLEDETLKNTLLCAVISVIYFTGFVQGLLIEPIIKYLGIPLEPATNGTIIETQVQDVIASSEKAFQAILGHSSQHTKYHNILREWFPNSKNYFINKFYKSNNLYANIEHQHLEEAYRKSWKTQKELELINKYDKVGRKYKKIEFKKYLAQQKNGVFNRAYDYQIDDNPDPSNQTTRKNTIEPYEGKDQPVTSVNKGTIRRAWSSSRKTENPVKDAHQSIYNPADATTTTLREETFAETYRNLNLEEQAIKRKKLWLAEGLQNNWFEK